MESTKTPPPPEKLWEHPSPETTQMMKFMKHVNGKRNMDMKTFHDLYTWSIGPRSSDFWADCLSSSPIIYSGTYTHVVDPSIRMDAAPKWFQGLRINYAENMLFTTTPSAPGTRSTLHKEDAKIAITEVREGCSAIRNVTWGALRARVALFSSAMRAHGVHKGDRVAVVASNSVDTLCVFLGVTALGGLFSSSSTDMGTSGVLARLTQVKPKWVFVDDGALYNGKVVDLRPKMREIVEGMGGIGEFEGCVSVPRWEEGKSLGGLKRCVGLEEFLKQGSEEDLRFERVEFNDPFLIVYSSGTTGQPKCIVHGTGNVILSAYKESQLHKDWDHNTVGLQYTTTGWIMYLTAVNVLLPGGRAVLYDGSPFVPDIQTFIRLIGEQKVTYLGISPRFLQTLLSASLVPRTLTDLSALQNVTSTGMVLSPTLFRWFYSSLGFPPHVHLANISGGTDIAGCFALDNPLTPVYVGGCQGPSLGVKVEVWDSTVDGGVVGKVGKEGENGEEGRVAKGRRVSEEGEPGELVATKPFVNMPCMFWPEGEEGRKKYRGAYFERFDNVWCHGDFIQKDPSTGQIIFLGRADGVLNPSGVRFGSAEIYSVIERNFPQQVLESICVGQRRPQDTDETVLLFLKMQPNIPLTSSLIKQIKDAIATECSKRHVPRYIFETPEIPTTVNLKKVELPIKHIVCGRTVNPSGTLLNPESLKFYYQFADIEGVVARMAREGRGRGRGRERERESKL